MADDPQLKVIQVEIPGVQGPPGPETGVPEDIAALPASVAAIQGELTTPFELPGGLVLTPDEAEIGATIAVTASVEALSKNPVTHSMRRGTAAPDALQPDVRTKVYTGLTATTEISYAAMGAFAPIADAKSVVFKRRQYWGARAATPNAAQIRAEFPSELIAAAGMAEKTVNTTGNKRFYLCLPKAHYPQVPTTIIMFGLPVAVGDNFAVTTVMPANGGAGTEPCWLLESYIVYDAMLEFFL